MYFVYRSSLGKWGNVYDVVRNCLILFLGGIGMRIEHIKYLEMSFFLRKRQ